MTSLTPVFYLDDEIDLFPVRPDQKEKLELTGLRCEFCGRFYKKFGTLGVKQVDVSKSGKAEKRWFGGESVWRCWRCEKLDLSLSLSGKQIINSVILKVPKFKMREKIVEEYVENVLKSIKEDLWNWR